MNDVFMVSAFRVDSNSLTNPERTVWKLGPSFYVCSRIPPSFYTPTGEYMIFRSNERGEVSDYLHLWEDDDSSKTHSQVFREFVEDMAEETRRGMARWEPPTELVTPEEPHA